MFDALEIAIQTEIINSQNCPKSGPNCCRKTRPQCQKNRFNYIAFLNSILAGILLSRLHWKLIKAKSLKSRTNRWKDESKRSIRHLQTVTKSFPYQVGLCLLSFLWFDRSNTVNLIKEVQIFTQHFQFDKSTTYIEEIETAVLPEPNALTDKTANYKAIHFLYHVVKYHVSDNLTAQLDMIKEIEQLDCTKIIQSIVDVYEKIKEEKDSTNQQTNQKGDMTSGEQYASYRPNANSPTP